MNDTPTTTRGILTGTVATRRQPKKIGRQTDVCRLKQLADAVADLRARPGDADAARTAGRLACMTGLLLLDHGDDRRRLMLRLLSDGLADASELAPGEEVTEDDDPPPPTQHPHNAPSSPPAASELEPDPDTADAAATQHAGGAGRLVGTTLRSNAVSPKGTVTFRKCVHPSTNQQEPP